MIVLSWNYEIVIPFLLGTFIFVIWWANRIVEGAPFHPITLGFATILYLAIFLLLETNDWLGFAGDFPVALLVLALATAALWAHSTRTTQVLRGPHGELGYRGSRLVAMVWFLVLLLEVYAQLAILGYLQIGNLLVINGFAGLPIITGGALPHSYAFVLAVTDALFALSSGATLGQNLGIYTAIVRYRLRARSPDTPAPESRPL
ncbi:MAG: hypothetical protein WAN87_00450 [Thermoplasmata archaeon]